MARIFGMSNNGRKGGPAGTRAVLLAGAVVAVAALTIAPAASRDRVTAQDGALLLIQPSAATASVWPPSPRKA